MQLSKSGILMGLGIVACIAQNAHASRFNVAAGRTGSPASGAATCRGCHGSTIGTGSVEILGAPDNYQANAVYDLTVRVSDTTRLGAGFQISVEDAAGNHVGALALIDPVNTELNSANTAFANHTSNGVDASVAAWAGNGNSYSYPVRWTAPSTDMGTVTFWAAGNAINNNFSQSCTGGCAPGCCDIVYLTTKSATFIAVPAVSTWGMVVFTLCLMTAGTIVAGRRKPALASVRADGY
jgi:hypothetical protein